MFGNVMLVALTVIVAALAVWQWTRSNKKKRVEQEPELEEITSNLSTPSGLKITVGVGPKRKPLPPSTDDCVVVSQSETKRNYPCGHKGPKWFILNTYGEDTKKLENGELCPECLIKEFKKYCIRCALCGLIICPGDGVALYDSSGPDLRLGIATRVGGSVIGCMRWDCCPDGGFFAGNWSEEGFKPRFSTSTVVEEAMAGEGKMVVVESVSDRE